MFQEIDPPAAKALLDGAGGVIYLDVRSQREFAEGHVPGALNIPILEYDASGTMAPNPDFPRVLSAAVPRDAHVIVGCKSGGRSARAAEFMLQAGWRNVRNLLGGFHGQPGLLGVGRQPGWIGCALPISQSPTPGRSYAELRALADTADASQ